MTNPTPPVQVPNSIRVPLDSLHADAEYLLARLLAGTLTREQVVGVIRDRIDAARLEIEALRRDLENARHNLRVSQTSFRRAADERDLLIGQQEGVGDYPALPTAPHKIGDINLWPASQMRAYADATCAMRAQADSQPALPKITAEDRSFLHYNPNTDDIVEWVQHYASAAITADRAMLEQAAPRVGTIGHIGGGPITLTAAVAPLLAGKAAPAAVAVPSEMHEAMCAALTGGRCTCERNDPAVDKAWARFCGRIGDGPDAPYPGMISAFERYYAQSFTDKDWRREASVWAAAWRQAMLAAAPTTQEAPQQEPVAWRHSKTLCLYETKAEVPLADGDEWAEPLYLATPQPAPVAQGDARAEQSLLKVLTAVQRYLPPDGPSAKDTLSEIIGIVDPWPLGDLKGKA